MRFPTANALHREGRLDEAMAAYRAIAADDPDYFKAQNNLALILEQRGELVEAEAAYRRGLGQRGDSEILHYNRARVLHRLNRLLEAIPCYHQALELDPRWADAAYNLAIAYHQQERFATAEAWYRRTLELAPEMPAAHRYLGDVLFDVGRHDEALGHYQRSLELDPNQPAAHFNLGKTLFVFGRIEEAEAAYRRSLALEPRSNAAYANLVELLRRTGQHDQARQAVQEWLAVDPANPVARHVWAGLTGENVAPRAGDDYVRQLFDEFAPDFDATLGKLNYQAPRLAAQALWAALPLDAAPLAILDAGCGTGLCGPLLRRRAGRLAGVDLSGGMLEKAHARRVYDELVQQELVAYLRERPAAFDAIVAADTFNYFGDLEELFSAVAGALRPHGVAAFTLERHDAADEGDWRLHPHGRYSHAEAYLRAALDRAGLPLVELATGELRTEGGAAVVGWVATARRGAAAG